MPTGPLAVSILLVAGAVAFPQTPSLAIVNVTVIDGTGAPPLAGATVVVERDRISCVGPARGCRVPPNARRIAGNGRWLIPGLFDAHVHLSERASAAVRALYLAHGITTVRDMGGYASVLAQLQKQLADGSEIGPRVFMAGHPIDGDPPRWPALYADVPRIARTEEDARRFVREAKESKADFVKLYHGLAMPAFEAAVTEAHVNGLKATADLLAWELPRIEQAIAAGLDGLEHGLVVSEVDANESSSRIEALLSQMQSRHVVLTTTLVLFERVSSTLMPVDAPTYRVLPRSLVELSEEMVRWSNSKEAWWLNRTCRVARLYQERGGQLLAGTDSFYLNVYPGDIHRELQLLVQCGLTPAQALAAATRAPAEWLRANDLGTLTTGKLADMVLLEADPLADIRNTQKIALVIQGGKVWTPRALLAIAHRSR